MQETTVRCFVYDGTHLSLLHTCRCRTQVACQDVRKQPWTTFDPPVHCERIRRWSARAS